MAPVISSRALHALALLRAALAPSVRVSLSPLKDGTRALTLAQPDGSSSILDLIPWTPAATTLPSRSRGASRTTRTSAVAWLTTRATTAQRQRWRERDENFLDLAGAIRLRLPRLLVDRTDLTPPRPRELASFHGQQTRNPFSDRGSLVLRTLLAHPGRTWTTSALADAACVSMATVSLVTEALNELNLVRVRREGRTTAITLDDPVAVITQWARRYDWRRNKAIAFAAPVGAAEKFLYRLPRVLGSAGGASRGRPLRPSNRRRWALTLQAGASLLAPHARWDAIHVYVEADGPEELIDIGERAGWPVSPSGKLVLLKPYYKTSVWHDSSVVRSFPVVSPMQLILDLWHYPVRGREQAERLLAIAGWIPSRESTTR